MAHKNTERTERLVEHIEAYLAGNPHAADTLSGIQTWWLSGAPSGVTLEELGDALRILVQRGALQRRRLPDGTQIFGR